MHTFNLEFNPFDSGITKFFEYRTARLSGWMLKIHLTADDLWYIAQELEDLGYKMDNHIVFCTGYGNFWIADNCLYIGGKVVTGSY